MIIKKKTKNGESIIDFGNIDCIIAASYDDETDTTDMVIEDLDGERSDIAVIGNYIKEVEDFMVDFNGEEVEEPEEEAEEEEKPESEEMNLDKFKEALERLVLLAKLQKIHEDMTR